MRGLLRPALIVGLVVALPPRAYSDPPPAAPAEPAWVWASETTSPHPVDAQALTDSETELQRACGRGEASLHVVAQRLVDRKIRGASYLDADGLAQAQRVAGNPHVWPRAFIVSGLAIDREATRQKLATWSATFREPGERRCGVAIGFASDGTEVVAAIAVDAAADLGPVPLRARTGQWLSIEAKLLVPATAARVVVMGPTGHPRAVPAEMQGDHVHARFAPDQPGAFTIQMVVDLANGPRPALEAMVFADTPPWAQLPNLTAPGETAAPPDPSDRSTLLAMVTALRASEHLRPLTGSTRLDAVGRAHAERMRNQRSVAHDVGDGDPTVRFEAVGVRARECGENVAHAATLALAHRVLYGSPSHRANLLSPSFDRVGVGVVRDPDGSVWVAEEFAGGAE